MELNVGTELTFGVQRNDSPGKAKMWWLFSTDLKSKEPASMEDRVARAIMMAWSSVREGLV